MTNFLNHLIADEVGTSAFLATLLDPRYNDDVFVQARGAIAAALKKHKVEFTETAPTIVEKEYLNIDLVVVWSPWTILIENKVAASSVTRGQLNEYYDVALKQMECKESGADKAIISEQPICFIYLTPTKSTGMVEFASLDLKSSRNGIKDIKIHMEWNELLEPLKQLTGMSDSFASSFLTAGLDRIDKVLEAAKNGRLPDDEDGRRARIMALMNNLKERLQNVYAQTSDIVFRRWSDKFKEQLFVTGPTRSAYVTLYISYGNSQFPSEGRIQASGDISFDIASKHRTRLRGFLAGKSQEEWCKLLGVASGKTQLNLEKGKLSWGFSLHEMATEEFLLAIEGRFLLFVSVFREILVEGIDHKAAQSIVPEDTP